MPVGQELEDRARFSVAEHPAAGNSLIPQPAQAGQCRRPAAFLCFGAHAAVRVVDGVHRRQRRTQVRGQETGIPGCGGQGCQQGGKVGSFSNPLQFLIRLSDLLAVFLPKQVIRGLHSCVEAGGTHAPTPVSRAGSLCPVTLVLANCTRS